MPDVNFTESWDFIYMRLAIAVSRRATCPRAHVGAVLVRAGRPLAIGYNGAPPGMPHCDEEGCNGNGPIPGHQQGCTNSVHAELNAVAWAARNGIATQGCTIYTTHQPCIACGQAIVSAGIREVVYRQEYHSAYVFPDNMLVRHYLEA